MSIQFNGDVTINGNMEVYDNGSVRITSNQSNIDINNLADFIESALPFSSNKKEYKEAAEIIKSSSDRDKLIEAFNKLKNFSMELGKNVAINGLSCVAIEAFKSMFSK